MPSGDLNENLSNRCKFGNVSDQIVSARSEGMDSRFLQLIKALYISYTLNFFQAKYQICLPDNALYSICYHLETFSYEILVYQSGVAEQSILICYTVRTGNNYRRFERPTLL
jgi:hypothetical protein